MACTSKWRSPIVRREASRTRAKASGRISSRVVSSAASRWRSSAVRAGKASGGSACRSASSPLISSTIGHSRRSVRSLALPKTRVSRLGMESGGLSSGVRDRSSLGLPCRPTDAVDHHGDRADLERTLVALPQPLGDADRGRVLGVNDAEDMLGTEALEGEAECGCPRLGREAVAPPVAREEPADLEARPALRVPEPHAPDQAPRRAFDHGPLPVAAELPVTEVERHLAPGAGPIERQAPEVAHDLDVGAHRREEVEVA